MLRNILITGGAGFIGSHLVRSLLSQKEFEKFRIIVLDDLSGGFRENVPRHKRVQFIKGSVTNKRLVASGSIRSRGFKPLYSAVQLRKQFDWQHKSY